uniref:Uncharacterized protein n=1 Tax=Glossina brevipalpis TaxID=37001 RepID=A0A1A9WVC9_9MUSC
MFTVYICIRSSKLTGKMFTFIEQMGGDITSFNMYDDIDKEKKCLKQIRDEQGVGSRFKSRVKSSKHMEGFLPASMRCKIKGRKKKPTVHLISKPAETA